MHEFRIVADVLYPGETMEEAMRKFAQDIIDATKEPETMLNFEAGIDVRLSHEMAGLVRSEEVLT